MKSVEVPDHTPVSSVATLRCNYHLGKDKLYSVKWYKDSSEFYRLSLVSAQVKVSARCGPFLPISDMFLETIRIHKFLSSPEFVLM